jgi:hypothetical protein
MKLLENYVSKILFKDTNNTYSVLGYIDIDGILTKTFINDYVNEVFQKNNNLHQYIIEKDDQLFLENIDSIDINEYYSIKYIKYKHFDKYIDKMLNDKFNTELKWKFLFCIDKEKNKSRCYFKIHHAYADGYQIIKMLTSPFQNNDITKNFKRETTFLDKLYYYFIGTIILLVLNVRIFINLLFKYVKNIIYSNNDDNDNDDNDNDDNDDIKNNTDYIIFKKFNFHEIKNFTKKNNITINDFLYSLMIKTDKLYRKKEKILLTISPINISGTMQTNNVCPIINNISNSYNDSYLLHKVNDTFNNFKFSLFIPFLHILINFIMTHIPLNILSKGYYTLLHNTDYVYSNIIGPPNFCLAKDVNVSNYHFLIKARNKEIIYSIISSGDNINIVCSFKKGVIKNKKKFKKYLYKAYSSIINK